jgi:hypothetical protein
VKDKYNQITAACSRKDSNRLAMKKLQDEDILVTVDSYGINDLMK